MNPICRAHSRIFRGFARVFTVRSAVLWTVFWLFMAANLIPWRTEPTTGYALYGLPVPYMMSGSDWPGLYGNSAFAWLPQMSNSIGPLSYEGVAFDILVAVGTLIAISRIKAWPEISFAIRRFRLRTMFVLVTIFAVAASLIAPHIESSFRKRRTTQFVTARGGGYGEGWQGPSVIRRLGMEGCFPGWRAITAITIKRRLTAEEFRQLCLILRENPQLEYLDLSASQLSDEELVELPEMPSLEFLDLSYNPINGTGLSKAHVTRSVKLLVLHKLKTEFTFPADANCPNVERLSLRESTLSDNSIEGIIHLRNLKLLDVFESGLSERAIEKLRQARPELIVR